MRARFALLIALTACRAAPEPVADAPPPHASGRHHAAAPVPTPPPPAPAPTTTAATSCKPGLVKKAQELADAYRAKHGVPGVALGIYDAGATCIVTSGVRGPGGEPVTPDTIFSTGSVQKVFNATLLAYDIELGRAKIDDPAIKYLASDAGAKVPAGSAFAKVTLKDLATHTASLPGSSEGDDEGGGGGADDDDKDERDGWNLYRDKPMPGATIDFLTSWKPPYPIGTKYAYSNLGFVLVGYAAVDAAKTSYTQLFREVITEPLGLKSTGPSLCEPPKGLCATGHNGKGKPTKRVPTGLWTTAEDMIAFVEANLAVKKLPDAQARAFARVHQPLFDKKGNKAIGMGWEIGGKGEDEVHNKAGAGSGFASWVAIEPRTRRGVAVLTNAQGLGDAKPPALGRDVLRAMR